MDIKAIVLITRPGKNISGSDTEETLGGVSMAYLDVLGLPIVERILMKLRQFRVSNTILMGNFRTADGPFTRFRSSEWLSLQRIESRGEGFWRAAEGAFEKCLQGGADLVLALRIGPYAEIDYEELIQHHINKHCSVTAVVDRNGKWLDTFVLNAAARADAGALFGSRMKELRKPGEPFRVTGYVNRLRDARDLRRLAVDGLLQKNSIQPHGTQIKPGVWVHLPARIHPRARVVAPAFIGAHARIRASAVITRASVVEHHAEVDCGTVVEDSTVLPFTGLGAGLEVAHSVSGFHRLYDLQRHTQVEIMDGKILGMKVLSPIVRGAGIAREFFAFKLKDIYRGLVKLPSRRTGAADLPESLDTAAALQSPVMGAQEQGPGSSDLASQLPVSRRYGR